MKLSEYLEGQEEKPAAFARRIQVSPVTVHRYLHKRVIPAAEEMARIVEATKGAVQPNDFYDLAPKRRGRKAG